MLAIDIPGSTIDVISAARFVPFPNFLCISTAGDR